MTASIKSNATSAELLVNGISQLVIDNTTPPTTANPQGAGANELARKDYVDGQALGVGQTWQDVLASRVSGTTYTNNTGKPIMVAITAVVHSADNGYSSTLAVDGVLVGQAYSAGAQQIDIYARLTAIVPNGATYVATTTYSGFGVWAELR